MSERDAGRKGPAAYSRVLALAAVAAMSLSACGSHPVAVVKTVANPAAAAKAAATKAAVTKAAACARVVSIKSELSDIRAIVFQTMSVGSPSRVWGPIVMDLDKQTVQLNKDAIASKRVCAGPVSQATKAPSGGATKAPSGGATEATGVATKASGGAARAPGRAKPSRIDHAKVAALTAEIRKRPQITLSMQAVGDIYFFAADYRRASAWYQRVLDVDPRDETALLAIGSAQFNSGNVTEAEKHWRVAEWLYPWNEEVHYDLGYLYQSQTPPDIAKMTAHWKRVIKLQPFSELADLVAPQLK